MSDEKAKGGPLGQPPKGPVGKVNPDVADVRDGAVSAATPSPSIAQGLQSVMAVIGENYTPPVSGGADKPAATSTADNRVAQGSKLTDKIDAARLKQSGGSSVTQGLQSIMAVIGEKYEEEPEPVQPAPKAFVEPSLKMLGVPPQPEVPVGVPAAPGKKLIAPAPQDRQNIEATNAISDLLPLLTDDEQGLSQSLQQVASSDQVQMSAPVQAFAPITRSDASIADLLDRLKSDITILDNSSLRARQQFNMPAVIDNASVEIRTLLAELQGDISALRNENDILKSQDTSPPVMAGQPVEIKTLLTQLQDDIATLRYQNDALKQKYGMSKVGGDGELSHLLTQLQGDISSLHKESNNFRAYYNEAGRSRRTSIGQAILMTIGFLALAGGSMIGGMYYLNSINGKNNDNLLALLGLQQPRPEKIVVRKPEAVVKKAAIIVPKVVAPKIAVVTPPPALPKITVKRPKLDSAEVQALIADAQNLIELGDLISARQMLEYAMSQKSAEATYKLGQTFDPFFLATMGSVLSVEPNITRAKVLYYSAARQGHEVAAKRLGVLRRTTEN